MVNISEYSDNNFIVCKRCVMDSTAADISFDINGVCNYCRTYENNKQKIDEDITIKDMYLSNLISKIKTEGAGKKYDCIVGVSGGVDSSWVLVKAVEFGLRPLAVHMDNGWNSELAQKNIEKLIKKLNVDLYTYVLDWNEFRDLQESFFNADVIDIELLTDNFLAAVNFKQASEWNVRFILSGSNTATEGIPMPRNWAMLNKYNKKNITRIWKSKGAGYKLNTIPIFSLNDYYYYYYIKGIKWYRFLDFLNYKKNSVISFLKNEFDYIPYPYKHYESIFTRLYQAVILPRKFGVDKRKNHLSALIMNGDISRLEAINLLKDLPYVDATQMQVDIEYFLKKFRWTQQQFDDYLKRPEVPHLEYGNDIDYLEYIQKIYKFSKYYFKK